MIIGVLCSDARVAGTPCMPHQLIFCRNYVGEVSFFSFHCGSDTYASAWGYLCG
jgi:hypothetical protein